MVIILITWDRSYVTLFQVMCLFLEIQMLWKSGDTFVMGKH
jgi:hypothetical protein